MTKIQNIDSAAVIYNKHGVWVKMAQPYKIKGTEAVGIRGHGTMADETNKEILFQWRAEPTTKGYLVIIERNKAAEPFTWQGDTFRLGFEVFCAVATAVGDTR